VTHSRFALGFTRNRKVFGLTDAAFRLYVSAIDWSREQRTDGVITEKDMPAIPRLPRSWRAVAIELVGAGLWEAVENGWRIIDWCEPEATPESELSAKRAEAGRKGGLAKASNRVANGASKPLATDLANAVATDGLAAGNVTDPSLSPTPPLPDSTGLDLSDSESSPALSSDQRPESKRARGERKAPKQARWRVVPEEFEPTDEHRRIARERGLDFNLELAKFRDHEFDKPKSDPHATFRNWLRNATPPRTVAQREVTPPGYVPWEQRPESRRFGETPTRRGGPPTLAFGGNKT
jgi:hypothetical protein